MGAPDMPRLSVYRLLRRAQNHFDMEIENGFVVVSSKQGDRNVLDHVDKNG